MEKYKYRIELENRKQRVLEYNNIIDKITKYNEKVFEIQRYEYVKDHQKNPSIGSSELGVLINWGNIKIKHDNKWNQLRKMTQ